MELKQIPINQIEAGEHAQRLDEDDEGISELTASILRVGVLVPIIVARGNGGYTLIAGHRRYTAAQRAGLTEMPCIVREAGEVQAKEVSFAENWFREDLSPVELAAAMKDCIESGALTVEGLAKGFHRSENWVCHQVAMMDWPADVLEVIHNGKISVAAASNLAAVEDGVYRDFLLRQAVENGATARATAAWLQAYRSSLPPAEAITREPVSAGERPTPMVPQAPCICCGDVFRTDELSHVPVCVGCIRAIRNIGTGG